MLLCVIIMSLGALSGRCEEEQTNTAEWEKAGLSRRSTALVFQRKSARLLSQAGTLKAKDYLSESEHNKNLEKAGDPASRAGSLERTAATNYEKESDNWLRAARAYEQEKQRKVARSKSKAALASAKRAHASASENYSNAATCYAAASLNAKARQASISAADRRLHGDRASSLH